MLPTNQYDIYLAGPADAASIRWLAEIDSRPVPRGRILAAAVEGQPVAALGIDDGSVIANPWLRTDHLVTALRMRARAYESHERTPSLRDRMLAGLRRPVVA